MNEQKTVKGYKVFRPDWTCRGFQYQVGKNCTGLGNTGNKNTGNFNRGDHNSGWYNTGNHNSGWCNTGNYNSGDYNIGNYNTGDYNVANYSGGCFNTKATKAFLFNKLSDWTRNDWEDSNAKVILDNIIVLPIDPIMEGDMTEKEKEEHPEYQTTGFYSKRLSQEEISNRNQKKWDKLSESSKKEVMSIPNFDKKIFKQITGIDVDKEV